LPAQYVALLQGQSGGPAFILTIDGATKNFTVRKVGATPEPGKSFELWLISDKLPRPRSLGVIVTWLANEVPAELEAFGKAVKNAPGLGEIGCDYQQLSLHQPGFGVFRVHSGQYCKSLQPLVGCLVRFNCGKSCGTTVSVFTAGLNL